MKFVFFGTAEFSVAILEKLLSDFYFPELVVCQPDKPVGRHQEMTTPLIKKICQDHLLKIAQPAKVGDLEQQLRDLKPDLFITASYGQIIPQKLLDIPKLGAINVHTSLLPKYRGASPIQAAIAAGEDYSGITIMMMDEKMDHGDIIFQKKVRILENETGLTLYNKLAATGADVLPKILPDFIKGKLQTVPQDHEQATFTKLINKDDVRIDWTEEGDQIERFIRAYYDWPIAWTVLSNGKRLKIIKASLQEESEEYQPGQLIIKDEAFIACGDGQLLILDEVQVEGNKITSGKEFARGYHQLNGSICS